MKIFLGAKFSGADNKEHLERIREILFSLGHDVFVGPIDIDNYGKNMIPPDKFMSRVFEEIRKSELLVLEHTETSTGMGIEAGFGKSLGKKIIVIYPSENATRSASIEGISDKII